MIDQKLDNVSILTDQLFRYIHATMDDLDRISDEEQKKAVTLDAEIVIKNLCDMYKNQDGYKIKPHNFIEYLRQERELKCQ